MTHTFLLPFKLAKTLQRYFLTFCLLWACGTLLAQPTDDLKALYKSGVKAFQYRKNAKAIQTFKRVRSETAKTLGKKHLYYRNASLYLAAIYFDQAKYAEAEKLYIEIKAISESAYGKEHVKYASACEALGGLYLQQGRYAEAEGLFIKSRQINAKKYGTQHQIYAFSCGKLAKVYYYQGRYEDAEPLYITCKKVIANTLGIKKIAYANACSNLGALYRAQGRYVEATPLFIVARTTIMNLYGVGHEDFAMACNNLGAVFKSRGLYAKAEPLYKRARAIYKFIVGTNHPSYALSCHNLATLYEAQGLYAKAAPLMEEARNLRAKFLGKKHPLYASSCNGLATIYYHQKQFKKAEPLLLEAKTIQAKILGKEHPYYANACNNLAVLYDTQGFYKKAESLYLEAKQIRAETLGKNHTSYAASCNNLAELYRKQEMYAKAEPLYREAKTIRARELGKEHPAYTRVLNNQAYCFKSQGNYNEATPIYLEIIQLALDRLRQNSTLLSEKEKKAFFASQEMYLDNFRGFVADYIREAQTNPSLKKSDELAKALQNLTLATKAQLLASKQRLLKLIKERIKTDNALRETYERYIELKNIAASNLRLTYNERQKRGIDLEKDLAEINSLEKKLYSAVKEETNTGAASFRQVRKALKKREAAVEIVRITKWSAGSKQLNVLYVAMITTAKTKAAPKILLLEQDKIKEKKYVEEYKAAILAKKADVKSYKRFFAPLAVYLQEQKIKKIYFSPDGMYNAININSLKNPATGKFVEEEFDIQLLTTLRDVVQTKKRKTENDGVAYLMGRPQYDVSIEEIEEAEKALKSKHKDIQENTAPPTSDSILKKAIKPGKNNSQSTTTRSGWGDLPGTEGEVKAIATVLEKYGRRKGLTTQLKLGKAVHELAIKSILRPKILHIATHGFFIPNNNDAEKMVKKVEKKKVAFRGGTTSNTNLNKADVAFKIISSEPMLRSGIALAGINAYARALAKPTHIEDGILTAYEASQMDLRGTELVVLSACETGLGDVQNGEGVYGLQRAFIVAGAQSVILSLWKVDDEATKILMSKFYEEWIKKGKTKRAAFRTAQEYLRGYKETYQHPYYWGAFQLIGR